MSLRPARCYRKLHRPYTRQSEKKPRKSYIKGVPKPKITEFELGKKGRYDKTLYLVSEEGIQIRHNALEAARVAAVQILEKNLGKLSPYFFRVRVYPHHVLRENALATGAGADRFQQGMRQSFGKPIGTAAQVAKGQKIMEIQVNSPGITVAKRSFKQAKYKLPMTCRVVVE